ncbi:MAG TPA: recombinase family protein [Solirubrobacteraceae bacterium]
MIRRTISYETGSTDDTPAAALPAGLEPVGAFRDTAGGPGEGLAQALAAIAAGSADTLYVSRLASVASSLSELVGLLQWLQDAGGSLVAADVALDTRDRAGERSIALLAEVERWSREGREGRRPRGRPGLRTGSPELAERIALLRQQGLSLQAIADRLNAGGIPTPRGGSTWRPSSVQAALGYRRPRPPAPGAPPPRPPGGPRHGPGNRPHKRPGPPPPRPPGS